MALHDGHFFRRKPTIRLQYVVAQAQLAELGTDGDASIPVEELARLADTIPYEILCGIGRRVKRRYLRRGPEPVRGAES